MKGKSAFILCLVFLALVGFGFLLTLGVGENKIFSIGNINQGLDLMGGVSILYEADKTGPTPEEMNSAKTLIQGRLDRNGYTEAEAAIEGENRIRVDIPGVDNAETAKTQIGATAQLYFAEITTDDEYMFALQDENGEEIRFNVLLTGDYVANAYRQVYQESQNSIGQQAVSLEFTQEGAELFETATARNIGKPLYIFMDGEVLSAATVNSVISGGNAVITGDFTAAYADELSSRIRAGSLPFGLNVVYMREVGAKLGADALSSSITAGIIGTCLVIIFILIAYKFLGVSADLALLIYVELVLLVLSFFRITLSLPGIAGIVLSIGMAVDANVIIFERIREELSIGKILKASIDAGFKKALPAILDGNVTTFMTAVVLFFLGSGPVRGFAQTLIIGILVSLFSALVVTRLILTSFVNIGIKNPNLYSKGKGGAAA